MPRRPRADARRWPWPPGSAAAPKRCRTPLELTAVTAAPLVLTITLALGARAGGRGHLHARGRVEDRADAADPKALLVRHHVLEEIKVGIPVLDARALLPRRHQQPKPP
eukprot:2378894-Prymnesium_polylepis.1